MFGFGLQTTQGIWATSSYLYRHKATQITFGVVEDNQNFPLEVGGATTPTGAFKSGTFVGGGATFHPRLEGDIGWLLYAAMGTASTLVDTPEAGMNQHVFYHGEDDTLLPWMSIYKYIPGAASADLMVKGQDCKITTLAFILPQSGLVQANLGVVGREPLLEEAPSLIDFDPFEGPGSVPIASKGVFTLDGASIPATGAVIEISNGLTTPREERILGSYFPDDFVPRSRFIQIRFTYKWEDPNLFQRILTGTTSGLTWSPIPTYTPFAAEIQSPGNAGALANPYSLRFEADRVHWRTAGPPALAGGGIVVQNYVGLVNEAVTGLSKDYARIILENEQASYVWPS
jgi:hypothetical protein